MNEKIEFRGWGIELRAILSNEKSYFSKKRIMSAAFEISVWVSFIIYMIVNIRSITPFQFIEVTGAMMVYAGFTGVMIQKEKKKDEIKS